MRKVMASGIIITLVVMICQPSQRGSNEVDEFVEQLRQSVQKGEMTKRNAVLEMEALVRKHKEIFDATPRRNDDGSWNTVAGNAQERCESALKALHRFDDKHSLPLFEEMTRAEDFALRYYGMVGYVRVAGAVDALPFIERLAKNPRVEGYYAPAYLTLIAITFNERILFREIYRFPISIPPPPPSELTPAERRKIHTFMLEALQTQNEWTVKRLDEALAKHLPDYAASIQRKEVAERFAQSDALDFSGNRISDHWKAIKDEIEKTPVEKRKDFRARGELFDPERKED